MKSSILHVIVTVLCCLLTVFATLAVAGSANDSRYASKDSYATICERIKKLELENREDHQDIRLALREILHEIGRIQGTIHPRDVR